MIAIEPFNAERQVWQSTPDGGMRAVWEPVRVLGVTENSGGAPVYVIEVYGKGESWLDTTELLRRRA